MREPGANGGVAGGGPLRGEREAAACFGEHCTVCSDEALEGRVREIRADGMAEVELGTGTEEVAVDLLDALAVGDRILVHAGVAIARIGA